MTEKEIDDWCLLHQQYRKSGDYDSADKIRTFLKDRGVVVESLKNERSRWRYV